MANIWKMLFGDKGRVKQASTLTPGQQQLAQQTQSGLMGGDTNNPHMQWLQSLYGNDPNAFAEYERPMMRQFNEEVVPGIAERFAGLGMGAQGSSAFQQQLASAAQRLSEGLGAQRANLRMGGGQQFQGYYGQAMNPQFQNFYQSPYQGMAQPAMQGAMQGAAYAAGGPMGGSAYNMLRNPGPQGGYGGYGGYGGGY